MQPWKNNHVSVETNRPNSCIPGIGLEIAYNGGSCRGGGGLIGGEYY